MARLTRTELRAIETALNQVLAGEEIDGIDSVDYPDEAESVRLSMESALQKVQDRLQ